MENNSPKRRRAAADATENAAVKRKFSLTGWIPRPVKRFWRRYNLTRVILLAVTVILIAITGYLWFLTKAANVSILSRTISAQTEILDNQNKVVGTLQGQKGTQLQFGQISQNVKNAVIATEDRTFYKNDGVNFERTILAALTLGHFGGGSTITQQLAKNAYLTQQQTIDRKAREIFLALQITKHYSKNDILTMYLNQNNYGNGAWGIEDAAHRYFGTSAANLTVDEAATLAGILKGPAIYNPLYSLTNATNRRNTVLQNMANAGFISQEQANQYMKADMKSELKNDYEPASATYKYPSYFNAVVQEAQSRYHLSAADIANGGYKIYTGMNSHMQDGIQETYAETDLFPTAADGTMVQSASVALDPKTGAVEALIGNAPEPDYDSMNGFNFATQSGRSPGSCIKPLIVYGPAVAQGWSIHKTLYDGPEDYNGWKPTDAEPGWRGNLPMYQMLAQSYNIPAINTYKTIGPSVGNALGKKFGLNLTEKNDVLPTALGAGVATNPWQMAQAYATFANGGIMHTAHVITKIENVAGQTIATAKVKSTRVISASVAKKMTSMMLGTFSNGTGAWAEPNTYTLAGKTGTNEDVDQWVIGYTPDIVMAEWLGFANPSKSPEYRLDGTSEGMASVIFRQMGSYILPWTKGSKFDATNPYVTAGYGPQYAAWTYQRSAQDDIVAQQQYAAGTSGNTKSSSSAPKASTAPSSSSAPKKSIGQTAKEIWQKFTDLFKH